MNGIVRSVLVGLAMVALGAAPVVAQQEQGAAAGVVAGRVTDAAGQPLAGAQVVARSEAAGEERGVAADGAGRYRLALPAGRYTLRAEAVGHRAAERAQEVAAGGTQTADFALVVAPVRLAELTVTTATRSATPLAAVPGAVSVVTREAVEEQSALTRNLGDLLSQVVPGLGAGMQSPSVFGQSLRGRSMAVLIDGVPQSTSRNVSRDLSTIDPAMVERVEVLRGATAIYGDGATGGVINIITRSAAEERARFGTTVGVDGSLRRPGEGAGVRVTQSVSGRRGVLEYAASASLDRTGRSYDAAGDLIPPDPHGQGGLAETGARDLFAKMAVSLGEQRIQLTVNRFDSEQETEYTSDPAVDALPAGEAKARALKGLELADPQGTENTVVSLDYTHRALLGSRVHAQAYVRDYSTVFRPFDGRRWPQFYGDRVIQSWLDSEKQGGRLEVETPLGGAAAPTLLWGVDYAREATAQPVHVFDNAAYDESGGLVYRIVQDEGWVPSMEPRSLGLFAQVAWPVGKRVLLRGGVRHERVRMHIDDFTTLGGNAIVGGELDFEPTLYNAGAVFTATDGVQLFGSFSQGFSLTDVGLFLRNAPAGFEVGTRTLEPQEVDHYELGARAEWSALSSSLSVFYNESDLGVTSGGFDMAVVRAPERVYGVEATADLRPVGPWALGGSLSWVEGEFAPNDGEYRALNGWRIQPLKVTAYVERELLPGWRGRLQALHSADRERAYEERANPDRVGFGERPVEGYTVLDLLTTVRVGPGTLRAGVENLLNAEYFPVASQLMRTGGNSSRAAGRGAALSLGYSVSY